jgi:hypothetical protein
MNTRNKPTTDTQHPDASSESHSDDIGNLIDATLSELTAANRKAFRAAKIQAVWEQVAPEEVLQHTDNVFLFKQQGMTRFIVYVDSPMWTAELMARKEYFKLMMEKALGEGPIDEMSFKTSSAAYRKKQFSKHLSDDEERAEPVFSPLSEDEQRLIDDTTGCVKNPGLRDSLRQAWALSESARKGQSDKRNGG